MKRPFAATVWRDGDWYVSQCLEIDIASQGETEEEALANLKEALELHFEPPQPTRPPSLRTVEVEVGRLNPVGTCGASSVRHPPRSGWLDELGRLKGGRAMGLGVARCAPYWLLQNCPLLHPRHPARGCIGGPAPVRTRRWIPRNREPRNARPRSSVPCRTAERWRSRSSLSRNPITEATGCFGRNRDAHVHMVRHQMSLHDLAFLLPRQRMENRTQLPARLPENGFPPPFGHEHYVVLAVPFGMG